MKSFYRDSGTGRSQGVRTSDKGDLALEDIVSEDGGGGDNGVGHDVNVV